VKYLILVLDGLSDEPLEALDGRTPLEAAHTPVLDELTETARKGTVATIPPGLPPRSEAALLSVLGYDPASSPLGRAALEADAVGLPVPAGHVCLRCNFVTLDEGALLDATAGNISSQEAHVLIDLLNRKVAPRDVRFLAGEGYRFYLVCPPEAVAGLEVEPPHEILGRPLAEHRPRRAETEDGLPLFDDILSGAHEVLSAHEINNVRSDLDENPANMIWIWGAGPPLQALPFADVHGLPGTMVTSIPFAQGIAAALRMDLRPVERRPDFEGALAELAAAAGEPLGDREVSVIYLQEPDAASHEGNPQRKTEVIEAIDRALLSPLIEGLGDPDERRVLILPGHGTSSASRRHQETPAPFALAGAGMRAISHAAYNELAADAADLHVERGHEFMRFFLRT